ncbi:TPA_asm: hypothetical protein vir519_00028 [Caudoviricetes sp. vir519]|nr:TPA_asm: hypothetical protein vir519_00028 [Caudoviricetes sp. vir519]
MAAVLPVQRSRQFQITYEPEGSFGTPVLPTTHTITWADAVLGDNFLKKPVFSDIPIGFSQPITVTYGPKAPQFSMPFQSIGGSFWNFLLGPDFTGTADEDIDGAAVGYTCFKHRIPTTQPYRGSSCNVDIARVTGVANDEIYRVQGAVLNEATITIQKDQFWQIESTILAQDVNLVSAARSGNWAVSLEERINGWYTSLLLDESEEIGFDQLRLTVNQNLKHSNDLTGTKLSSDLKGDEGGVEVALNGTFEVHVTDYIQKAFDEEHFDSVEIRFDDGNDKKMKVLLTDCYFDAPSVTLKKGDTEIIQNMILKPTGEDHIIVNRSFPTASIIDEW